MFRKTVLYTALPLVLVLLTASGLDAGCGLRGWHHQAAGHYYSTPVQYSGSGCQGYQAGCQGFQAQAVVTSGNGCYGASAGGCVGGQQSSASQYTAYYAAPVYSGGCVGYQAGSGCVGQYGAGNGHRGIVGRIRDRRASRHATMVVSCYEYPPAQAVQFQAVPVAQPMPVQKAKTTNPDCKCGPDCKCVECACGPQPVQSSARTISPPVYRWCDPVTGECHLVQLR